MGPMFSTYEERWGKKTYNAQEILSVINEELENIKNNPAEMERRFALLNGMRNILKNCEEKKEIVEEIFNKYCDVHSARVNYNYYRSLNTDRIPEKLCKGIVKVSDTLNNKTGDLNLENTEDDDLTL